MQQTLRSSRLRKGGFWLVGIGALIVVVGLSLSKGTRIWYNTRTWTLLQLPVVLAPGHIRSPEFATNIDENFWVELNADRWTPSPIADGVLGIGDPVSMNFDQAHGFKLAWSVICEGKTIKNGMSNGRNEGYWSDRIGRRLGWFHAEKGKRYVLDVDVLEDATPLQPYHPRLVVEIDLFKLDGYAIGIGLWSFVGLVLSAIGGVLLLIAAVRSWWLSRSNTERAPTAP